MGGHQQPVASFNYESGYDFRNKKGERMSSILRKDYYRILGLSPLCTMDEIHKNYRTLAKQYHPDICKEKILAEEKMREVAEAYDTLKDYNKRKEYDQNKLFQFREYRGSGPKKKGTEKKKGFFESLFEKKEPKSKWKIDKPFREKNPVEFSFTMGVTYSHSRTASSIDCAKSEFQKIIGIDSRHGDAYYNLGLCHYLLGEFEDAQLNFRKANAANPKDTDAKQMAELLFEKYT